MRAVILNDHITPYRLRLFEGLRTAGIDAMVLYTARRLPGHDWDFDAAPAFAHKVLPHFVLKLRRPPYNEPRLIVVNPTLFSELVRLDPDVVVGYSYSLPAWTAFAYARLHGKKYVSWSTDSLHSERHLRPGQRLARRWLIPRADACLTISQVGAEKFVHYGADAARVFIAPQGADPDGLGAAAAEARLMGNTYADQHGLRGHIILYVGALTQRKGVAHLINALPLVRARVADARLLIVGSGLLRAELEAQADALGVGDVVHFAGFVQPAEIAKVYASGQVFAFPTLEDAYGSVIAEAASCGLPLVVSRYAGASGEFVIPGENGAIIDPVDREAFARALIDVLSDERRRQRMGLRSEEISRECGVDAALREFAAALETAAQGPEAAARSASDPEDAYQRSAQYESVEGIPQSK